jgi:hypothetical protein
MPGFLIKGCAVSSGPVIDFDRTFISENSIYLSVDARQGPLYHLLRTGLRKAAYSEAMCSRLAELHGFEALPTLSHRCTWDAPTKAATQRRVAEAC